MRVPLVILAVAAVGFAWWMLWPVLIVVAIAVCVAAVVTFVVRLLADGWRVYLSDQVDGPAPVPISASANEPAFRHYLAGQVWRDAATTVVETVKAAGRPAFLLSAGTTQVLLAGWRALPLAPVWLAVMVGVLAGVIGCALMLIVLGAGYVAAAATATGLTGLGAGIARGLDGLLVSARRTRPACPHPGCYRGFRLPEYLCPGCGARHRALRPGRYGALRRVCQCGTRLPTSVVLGRSRLSAACPGCHRPLTPGIGTAPVVHVPVVGGPAAGKSTYTHLAVGALEGTRFTDPDQKRRFGTALQALRAGTPLPRTPVELPAAMVLDVTVDDDPASRCLMYVFDPPGEHYTTTERIAWQRYLDLASGLLVILDPFSLDAVRRSLSPDERAILSEITPSDEDPAYLVDRLVSMLRTRPDGGRLRRIAVVVTKVDALRRTGVGQDLLAEAASDGADLSARVQAWLARMGWDNPMRVLSRICHEVRYFTSGLDVSPDRLAAPIRWLVDGALAGRRVRTLPALATREVSAETFATARVPRHYRVARRLLLALMWLLVLGGVAALGAAGVVGWRLAV